MEPAGLASRRARYPAFRLSNPFPAASLLELNAARGSTLALRDNPVVRILLPSWVSNPDFFVLVDGGRLYTSRVKSEHLSASPPNPRFFGTENQLVGKNTARQPLMRCGVARLALPACHSSGWKNPRMDAGTFEVIRFRSTMILFFLYRARLAKTARGVAPLNLRPPKNRANKTNSCMCAQPDLADCARLL
jgi:hypothetical protein